MARARDRSRVTRAGGLWVAVRMTEEVGGTSVGEAGVVACGEGMDTVIRVVDGIMVLLIVPLRVGIDTGTAGNDDGENTYSSSLLAAAMTEPSALVAI